MKDKPPKSDAWYQAKYGWFENGTNGIKSAERVRKYADVLTPRGLAEKMVDAIPGCADN